MINHFRRQLCLRNSAKDGDPRCAQILGALLKYSFGTIAVLDDKNRFVFVNKIENYIPDELIGKDALSVCPEPERFLKIADSVRRTGKPHKEENVIVSKIGGIGTARVIPLKDKWLLILLKKGGSTPFSKRELEIAQLGHLSAKQISEKLNISVHTVSAHRKNIKNKI